MRSFLLEQSRNIPNPNSKAINLTGPTPFKRPCERWGQCSHQVWPLVTLLEVWLVGPARNVPLMIMYLSVFFLCCYVFPLVCLSEICNMGAKQHVTKALFTWLLYSFGQLPIVVVPTVLSAILALVPKVSPVWSVSFWAAVYLWLHSQKVCATLHLTSR